MTPDAPEKPAPPKNAGSPKRRSLRERPCCESAALRESRRCDEAALREMGFEFPQRVKIHTIILQ
jgi:hypothetical protein